MKQMNHCLGKILQKKTIWRKTILYIRKAQKWSVIIFGALNSTHLINSFLMSLKAGYGSRSPYRLQISLSFVFLSQLSSTRDRWKLSTLDDWKRWKRPSFSSSSDVGSSPETRGRCPTVFFSFFDVELIRTSRSPKVVNFVGNSFCKCKVSIVFHFQRCRHSEKK